jgi:hypothetical protein
LKERNGYQTL